MNEDLLVSLVAIVAVILVLYVKTSIFNRRPDPYEILFPLSELLNNPAKIQNLLTTYKKLEGTYKNRKVCAEIDVNSGQYSNRCDLNIRMKGLRNFPEQPAFMKDYPYVIGKVVHIGDVVILKFNWSEREKKPLLDRDFYLGVLSELVASAEKLEYEGQFS